MCTTCYILNKPYKPRSRLDMQYKCINNFNIFNYYNTFVINLFTINSQITFYYFYMIILMTNVLFITTHKLTYFSFNKYVLNIILYWLNIILFECLKNEIDLNLLNLIMIYIIIYIKYLLHGIFKNSISSYNIYKTFWEIYYKLCKLELQKVTCLKSHHKFKPIDIPLTSKLHTAHLLITFKLWIYENILK